VLSSRAVDDHQVYFEGLVVGKALTFGILISLTAPLVSTGVGQKVRNSASFETSLKFEPPAFENAARYPNSETKALCCDDRPMFWSGLVKLGSCNPERALSVLTYPLKLQAKTR